MREATDGDQPEQPEPSEAKQAQAGDDGLPRDGIAEAIPTVEPSPKLSAPRLAEPAATDVPPEIQPAELAVEHPAPEVVPLEATPVSPAWEPAADTASLEPSSDRESTEHSTQPLFAPANEPGNAAEPVSETDVYTTSPSVTAPENVAPGDPLLPLAAPEHPVRASEHTVIEEAQRGSGPAEEQAAPVGEEQIWSGPEATHVPENVLIESRSANGNSSFEADGRAAALGAQQQPTHYPVLFESAAATQPQAARLGRVVPSWPPVARPSDESVGKALHYLRLAARAAIATVLGLVATVLLLVLLYRWVDPPTSTLILGQRLTGIAIEQAWVPLERISPNLVHAVILSEDGGFCRHRGVDWSALEEAIENDRGGSTITMQVVKNLFLWPARSYVRKALEIMLAYLVETLWPKQRVLEIYLNIAEWGPGVFGAEAAARHHFGKTASELSAQEAALLAVALPSPIERQAAYPGYQQRRLANNLLARMRAVRTTMRCVRVRRGEN